MKKGSLLLGLCLVVVLLLCGIALADPPDNCQSLSLNEPAIVTVSEGGQIVYFSFVPESTGVYQFCSDAGIDSDTYGYLFNENMEILRSDDDGGTNSNFNILYELSAGTTYYFGAAFYDEDTIGSFSISLTLRPRLSTPVNLRWDGITARWDTVPNAYSYTFILEFSDEEGVIDTLTDNYVFEDYYDLTYALNYYLSPTNLENAIYYFRFSIKAVPEDSSYSESTCSEYSSSLCFDLTERTQLSTPKNPHWDNMLAKWDPVPNAEYYYIEIIWITEDDRISTYEYSEDNSFDCSYTITDFSDETGLTEGTLSFQFKVSAKSDDYEHYISSGFSDCSSVLYYQIPYKTKLQTPSNLRWEGNVAKWDKVKHANGYALTLDVFVGNNTGTFFLWSGTDSLDCSDEIEYMSTLYSFYKDRALSYRFYVAASPYDRENHLGSDWTPYSPPLLFVYGPHYQKLTPLTTYTLPKNIKQIGTEAFSGTGYKAIIVPEGCSEIGERAFAFNDKLLYVSLPKSVVSYPDNAFEGSSNVFIDHNK